MIVAVNYKIRRYSIKDKSGVLALLKLNTPNYFDKEEEEDFSTYLDTEIEDYFVVEDNSKVIGSGGINYFPEERVARISWGMIHPDYQGKGIGRELTLYRINFIRKNLSANYIVVRTSQFVYKFYQKLGFKLDRVEKDFWAKGFDLYLLKLTV